MFEGNVKVAWNQFYFETERHAEAYYAVSHNAVQHPIAIQGAVSSVRTEIRGEKSKNVINLQMNTFRADTDDSENGIGLEVSIWAKDPAWIKGIEKDDEIVVLGMWKHSSTGTREIAQRGTLQNPHQAQIDLEPSSEGPGFQNRSMISHGTDGALGASVRMHREFS
ncbi:hypothetical protein [Pseudomonas sp. Sample_21]|uniref:hypothetical protein n=1 Tax=Pseudomonas sp. Sample_21 TaxID=2448265 RepID=UPI001F4FAA26|nr:hypothetical protein [Pseudomonas sp. Sample_21]